MLVDGAIQQRKIMKKVFEARSSGEKPVNYEESTLTKCLAPFLSGNSRLALLKSTAFEKQDLFDGANKIKLNIKGNKANQIRLLLETIHRLEAQQNQLEAQAETANEPEKLADLFLMQAHLKSQVSQLRQHLIKSEKKDSGILVEVGIQPTCDSSTKKHFTPQSSDSRETGVTLEQVPSKEPHTSVDLPRLSIDNTSPIDSARFSIVSPNLRRLSSLMNKSRDQET